MKKIIFSIICCIIVGVCTLDFSYAANSQGAIDFNIENINKEIVERSIQSDSNITGSPVETINQTGLSLLTSIKTILSGLMVIYVVYAGAQMIMSMGTDEDQLSSAKRQLRYTVVAFIFINIPGALFNAFDSKTSSTVDARTSYSSWFKSPGNEGNIFIDTFSLGKTLNTDIIGFAEILIASIAIVMIIIAGINMMTSRGKEEKVTEAKEKVKWSIVALLIVGFLESWKHVVYSGKVEDGGNFFESATNLALFFVGPIAIIFLTIAAYMFITSNGDEDKLKKAKSIVINVLLATVILLASYTFLLDLVNL